MTTSTTPAPGPVHDMHRPDLGSTLDQWLLVQHAIRCALASTSPVSATAVLRCALDDLGPAAGEHPTQGVHLDAQRAVLNDLVRVVESAVWAQAALADTSPAGPGLTSAPPRPGDVLCLLRITGTGVRESSGADMADLFARVRAAVRTEDLSVVVDDRHLLVVMRSVSVPVTWRRMNELVGRRSAPVGGSSRVVHAGLAPVGDAGSEAATGAARAALDLVAEESTEWISVAEAARPPMVPTTGTGGEP